MVLTPSPYNLSDGILADFLERLQRIFAAMDREYTRAIEHYGFRCDGCLQNCCRTRFHHHTYLEYLYVLAGFKRLDLQRQREVQSLASEVCRETAKAESEGTRARLWCPLNGEGRCILYAFRPMICRLHGIPHELQKPGQVVVYGPGCGTFDDRCANKSYFKFDRTPFYFEMASLESEYKEAAGLKGRIKMTISEMIIEFGSRNSEVGMKSKKLIAEQR
jgi:Fe-S-cluster containining protein